MKRKIALFLSLLLAAASLPFAFAGCVRGAKYDGLNVGTLILPKNLMPYDSNTGAATLITGLIYDSLLDIIVEPTEGKYPDGTAFTPADDVENPFHFKDLLVTTAGVYPKKSADDAAGREDTYTPTEDQRNRVLSRKLGTGYAALPDREKEESVPSDNWFKYTLEVVGGNTWNDGTPFTAEDIKFTFDYITLNRGALASQAMFLANYSHSAVHGGGKYLDFYLATHKTSDIKTICNSIPILPKHIWESISKPKNEKNTNNPVGTHAYKLQTYAENNSVTLALRDDYAFFGDVISADAPKFITITLMGTADIMLQALEKGDIDVIWEEVEAGKAKQIRDHPDLYKKIKLAAVGTDYADTLLLNVNEYNFDNKEHFADSAFGGKGAEFRKAVSLAIDQDELIDKVLYGYGRRVGPGLVTGEQPHALTDGPWASHKKDIDEANRILDEAGFNVSGNYRTKPGGASLTVKILARASNERVAQALTEQFAKIKVNFEYERAFDSYSDDIKFSYGSNFDAIINRVTYAFPTILMFDARYGFYPGTSNPRLYNYSGLDDPVLRGLMADMENEKDPAAQIAKAHAVQTRLAGLYLELPLYSPNMIYAYNELRYKNWVSCVGAPILGSDTFKYIAPV